MKNPLLKIIFVSLIIKPIMGFSSSNPNSVFGNKGMHKPHGNPHGNKPPKPWDNGEAHGDNNSDDGTLVDPNISMGVPSFSGTGCNDQDTAAVLSPDQKTLSILLANFRIELNDQSGIKEATSDCKMRIPFFIPEGIRVQVVGMDFRGYNYLPEGARSALRLRHRYLNPKVKPMPEHEIQSQNFQGPLDAEFTETMDLKTKGPPWSMCGQNFDLIVNSRLVGKLKDDLGGNAITEINSIDTSSAPVTFKMSWKKCKLPPGQNK